MPSRADDEAADTSALSVIDVAPTAAAALPQVPVSQRGGAVRGVGGADAAALAVAAVWGSTYVSMKVVGASLSVPSFLATRFSLGALVVTLVAFRQPGRLSRSEVRLGVEFGCLLFVILALETAGVRYTTAANAGFLIAISVLLVPLVERIGLGRRAPPGIYLCIVLGLCGVGLLTLQHGLGVHTGDVIIFAAALIRAIQIVAFGRRAQGVALSLLRVTAVELWVVAAFGATLSLVQPVHSFHEIVDLGAGTWGLLVYLGVLATAFAFLAQLYAARASSPTRVGIIMSTEPVFAAACAIVFLGEQLGPLQWLGGGLVVIAVIAGRWLEARWRGQSVVSHE